MDKQVPYPLTATQYLTYRGALVDPKSFLYSAMAGTQEGKGWGFHWGDPELWRIKDQLIVPNGKALDVGMGTGRASMFFALHGMTVQGIDLDEESVAIVNALGHSYDLPLSASVGDVSQVELVPEEYDIALFAQTFIHFPSKQLAFDALEKVLASLKHRGKLWVRAATKADSCFEDIQLSGRKIDEDVYEEPCACTGVYVPDEKHLFFDQTDLVQWACANRLRIIHSEAGTQVGAPNILYGKDVESYYDPNRTWGFVTILVEKP